MRLLLGIISAALLTFLALAVLGQFGGIGSVEVLLFGIPIFAVSLWLIVRQRPRDSS